MCEITRQVTPNQVGDRQEERPLELVSTYMRVTEVALKSTVAQYSLAYRSIIGTEQRFIS